MNHDQILKCVAEAEEFIRRAKEIDPQTCYWASRNSGALRRQSMELTRALADLRQGRGPSK